MSAKNFTRREVGREKAINFAPVDAFIAHARDVIYVNAAAKLWHCVYRVVRIQSHTHEKTSSQVSLMYIIVQFYFIWSVCFSGYNTLNC
jgi:hypothetical protein